VRLPDIGEGIEKGTVVGILVAVGDTVAKDQPLVELETDKAVVEIPSTAAGVVSKINVSENEEAAVGSVLIVLEEEGAAASQEAPAPAATEQEPAPASRPESAPPATETAATETAATETAATEADSGDVAAGKTFFAATCTGCHMADGTEAGGVGPKLAGLGLTTDFIRTIIVDGGTVMPAGLASGDDLDNVVAYVESIQ
jgi:mono/diheme cytochrome c family protein